MRVIMAPDSFKEALSSAAAGEALRRGWLKARPDDEVLCIPVADGGEGTAEAYEAATGGTRVTAEVVGPLGDVCDASYLITPDGRTAVIEMAASSGLQHVAPEIRDPLISTSFGVGNLMISALDHGVQRLIIGLGGSATVDGGAGMFQALGGSLRDAQDEEIPFGGSALCELVTIDTSEMDPRLVDVEIMAATDVPNPLLGEDGAAAVFGPQKGADAEGVKILDEGLGVLARVMKDQLGKDIANIPGAGAAGGLGGGLVGFLDAALIPGAELILDISGFKRELETADLIITGEGRMDRTSFGSKLIGSLARDARACGVPVIALVGSLDDAFRRTDIEGLRAVFTIANGAHTLTESLVRTEQDLERTAEMIAAVLGTE